MKEAARKRGAATLARAPFGRKAAEAKPADGRRDEAGKSVEEAGDKAQTDFFFADRSLRERVRQLYQKLDKTQEWAENNYYQLPIEQQTAELVPVNAILEGLRGTRSR